MKQIPALLSDQPGKKNEEPVVEEIPQQVPALLKKDKPLKNIQKNIKNGGRGGKRQGAGRKLGSTNKIQGTDFIEEYKKVHGSNLIEDLVKDIQNARERGDHELVYKYTTAFAKYYMAEPKQEVDITSNGQGVMIGFSFTKQELDDWK